MNLTDAFNGLLRELAVQMRGYAKDVGTACSIEGREPCDALTLGVRCEKCLRRICSTHTFWSLTSKKPLPYCPYCVLRLFPEIFREPDSTDDEDVIDAEIVD